MDEEIIIINEVPVNIQEYMLLKKIHDENIGRSFFPLEGLNPLLITPYETEPNILPMWVVVKDTHVITLALFINEDPEYFIKSFIPFTYLEKIILYHNGARGSSVSKYKNPRFYPYEEILLPESISRIKNLKHLKVEGKFRLLIPETFPALKNLLKLELYEVEISQYPQKKNEILKDPFIGSPVYEYMINSIFPETLCNSNAIEELSWEYNFLNILPSYLTKLQNLKKITIRYSDLKECQCDFQQFPQLEQVVFFQTKLKKIPHSLINLIKLKKVSFEGDIGY